MKDYETLFSEIIDLDIYGKNSNRGVYMYMGTYTEEHRGRFYGPYEPNDTGHTVVQCKTDSEYCQKKSNQLSPPAYGWRRPGIHPKDYLFPHFVGDVNSDFCNKN